MEDVELVRKMIDELEKKCSSNKKIRAESLLEGITKTRMFSLQETIDEIREQIKIREDLHRKMLENIENLKSSIHNMMPQMPTPTIEFQKAMVELKKKLIEAEEMKIKENLDCFRDVALLKKELREFLREFRDKEKRASLLGELLAN